MLFFTPSFLQYYLTCMWTLLLLCLNENRSRYSICDMLLLKLNRASWRFLRTVARKVHGTWLKPLRQLCTKHNVPFCWSWTTSRFADLSANCLLSSVQILCFFYAIIRIYASDSVSFSLCVFLSGSVCICSRGTLRLWITELRRPASSSSPPTAISPGMFHAR